MGVDEACGSIWVRGVCPGVDEEVVVWVWMRRVCSIWVRGVCLGVGM